MAKFRIVTGGFYGEQFAAEEEVMDGAWSYVSGTTSYSPDKVENLLLKKIRDGVRVVKEFEL